MELAFYYNTTAALHFKEFSFTSPEGDISYAHISKENLRALKTYPIAHYNAAEIVYSEPFITILYDPEVPPDNNRPFSIAGMIAVWRTVDKGGIYTGLAGEPGRNEDYEPDLPQAIAEDL